MNSRKIRAAVFGAFLMAASGFALTNGPVQPEFTSFEPVDVTDLVNLPTGDFAYTIPLGEVKGSAGVGYPIVLSYHAGIQTEQEASWVGLGWNLNVGAINRQVIGFPDDHHEATTVSYLWNPGEQSHESQLSVGWYGFSVNFGWNNKGFEGVTGIGVGYHGVGLSYDFKSGAGRVHVGQGVGLSVSSSAQGTRIGVGLTSQSGFSAQVGIAFDNKMTPSYCANVGMSTPAGDFSIATNNGQFSASGPVSVGMQQNFSKNGVFQSSEMWGFAVIIPYVNVTVGYTSINSEWHYSELKGNTIYGYLYQSPNLTQKVETYNKNLSHYMGDLGWSYEEPATNVQGLKKTTGSSPSGAGAGAANVNVVMGTPKMEYAKLDTFNLPSQDIYMVTGQGMNGMFKPFAYNAMTTYFSTDAERDADYYKLTDATHAGDAFNTSDMKISPLFKDGIVFKMLSETNYNLIDKINVDGYTESNPYSTLDQTADGDAGRVCGTRIEPLFGLIDKQTKLDGFIVTDQNGTSYHYTLPLRSRHMVAFSNSSAAEPASIGAGYEYSYTYDNESYATTWLLTAITGPDYIKRNFIETGLTITEKLMPREGDYGYWVRFRYAYDATADKKVYPWRNPYEGFVKAPKGSFSGPNNQLPYKIENRYVATYGRKDITYLKSIETASEVAYFKTIDRDDGKGLDPASYPTMALDIVGLETDIDGIEGDNPGNCPTYWAAYQNPFTFHIYLPGDRFDLDWYNGFSVCDRMIKFNLAVRGTKKIITFIGINVPGFNGNCTIFDPDEGDRNCQLEGFGYIHQITSKVGITDAAMDYSQPGNPRLKLTVLSIHPSNMPPYVYLISGSKMTDNPDLIPSNKWKCQAVAIYHANYYNPLKVTNVQKELDQILWYSKSKFPSITGAILPAPADAQPYRSVNFTYTFDLAKNTPNSSDAQKGRLTLKQVQFGSDAIEGSHLPPYLFSYQGTERSYGGITDADPWGYPDADPDNIQLDNPNRGIYWNLKKIIMPSGSSMDISYERDRVNSSFGSMFKIAKSEANDLSLMDVNRLVLDRNSNECMKLSFDWASNVSHLGTIIFGNINPLPSEIIGSYCSFYRILEYEDPQQIPLEPCFTSFYKIIGLTEDHKGIKIDKPLFDDTQRRDRGNWIPQQCAMWIYPRLPARVGDLRVKNITLNGVQNTITTHYEYGDGVLDWAPQGAIPCQMDTYRKLFTNTEILKDYKTGGTSVTYPWVSVSNIKNSENTQKIAGYTKYSFFTPDDMLWLASNKYEPIVRESVDKNPGIWVNRIVDRSAILNQIKSIEMFDNTGKLRSKTRNNFIFSDELASLAGVLYGDLSSPITQNNKPLGLIRQHCIQTIKAENSYTYSPKAVTDIIIPKVYLAGVTQYKDGVEQTTSYGYYDARTGEPTCIVSENIPKIGLEQRKLDVTIPYHFMVSTAEKQALYEKNINNLFGASVAADISTVTGINRFSWDDSYICTKIIKMASLDVFSTANSAIFNIPALIKKADAKLYATETFSDDVEQVPFDQFRFWSDRSYSLKTNTAFALPTNASVPSNWIQASRVTAIDKLARVRTEINAVNIPSTVCYHPRMNQVVGAITNAKFNNTSVYTCDYDEMDPNHPSYCDYNNGWERGGILTDPANGEKHFGKRCVKVSSNFGPTCNILPDPDRNRNYIFSAWVKITAGASVFMNVEYRNALDATKLNKWPIVCNCVPDVGDPVYDGYNHVIPAAEATEWKYFEWMVSGQKIRENTNTYFRVYVGNAGIPNSEAYFDDLRFYPENSLVTTFYYDQELGVPLTFVDANGAAKRFKYDVFGRLIEIKNNAGVVVKSADYDSPGGFALVFISPSVPTTYRIGARVPIIWESFGSLSSVGIQLYYSTDKINWTSIGTGYNVNSYLWTIPNSMALNTDYWLKIEPIGRPDVVGDITRAPIRFVDSMAGTSFFKRYIMNLLNSQ